MKIEEIALNVIDALNAEQIPYMLVGSFSSNYYGIPRSTADVDFVVHLTDKSIGSIVQHLDSSLRLEPQMVTVKRPSRRGARLRRGFCGRVMNAG